MCGVRVLMCAVMSNPASCVSGRKSIPPKRRSTWNCSLFSPSLTRPVGYSGSEDGRRWNPQHHTTSAGYDYKQDKGKAKYHIFHTMMHLKAFLFFKKQQGTVHMKLILVVLVETILRATQRSAKLQKENG